MNVWQRMYTALDDAGIRVYAPGRHVGICDAPYCVIQQYGTYPMGSSDNEYTNFLVHAYVPLGSYISLAALIDELRDALSELEEERLIYSSGGESPHLIDDEYAAHTAYLEYRAYSSDN